MLRKKDADGQDDPNSVMDECRENAYAQKSFKKNSSCSVKMNDYGTLKKILSKESQRHSSSFINVMSPQSGERSKISAVSDNKPEPTSLDFKENQNSVYVPETHLRSVHR